MKQKMRLVRLILFLIVVILVFHLFQALLMPKWTEGLASTAVINGFYAEERDSLDVVFFGTSHQICGISPMELYGKTGLRGYVLATGNQPIQATYYWIREAHKRQKNMVAVVDLWSLLFEDQVTEGVVREAIDEMRFSPNKAEAILTLCNTYDLSPLDYFLPLLRYHDRIEELSEKDTDYLLSDKHSLWKGHYPIPGAANMPYQGLTESRDWDKAEPVPIKRENAEYLQKIVEYCDSEEIPLLLVKLPVATWTPEQHIALKRLVEEQGRDFFDMNLNPFYQQIGLDDSMDYQGPDHLDMMGAVKVTDALGSYLLDQGYLTAAAPDPSDPVTLRWDSELPVQQHAYKSLHLPLETDIRRFYSDIEGDEDYLVFLGYEDMGIPEYSEEYEDAIGVFGIEKELIHDRRAKLARIEYAGERLMDESTEEDELLLKGVFQKGTEPFGERLLSDVCYDYLVHSDKKEIRIDDEDRSTTGAIGLQVIVYSLGEDKVICSVCFIPVGNGDVYWQVHDLPMQ